MSTTTTRKAAALAFASRLNALLEQKKVTRRELARRLSAADSVSFETARSNVHRMLRGEHVPNASTRQAVASALQVDPSEFEEEALSGDPFRGSGEPDPDGGRSRGGQAVGGKGVK